MPKAKYKLKNWSSPLSSTNVFDNSNFAQSFSSVDDDPHAAIAVNNTFNDNIGNTVKGTKQLLEHKWQEHKWQDGNKVKNFMSKQVAKYKENKKVKENVKVNIKEKVKENVKENVKVKENENTNEEKLNKEEMKDEIIKKYSKEQIESVRNEPGLKEIKKLMDFALTDISNCEERMRVIKKSINKVSYNSSFDTSKENILLDQMDKFKKQSEIRKKASIEYEEYEVSFLRRMLKSLKKKKEEEEAKKKEEEAKKKAEEEAKKKAEEEAKKKAEKIKENI